MAERDRLFRLYKNNPRNINYQINYKKCRNKLNKKINKVKNEFYQTEFTKARSNVKVFWDKINQVLGRKKTSIDDLVLQYIVSKDKPKQSVLEEFTNYFVECVAQVKHRCHVQLLTDAPITSHVNRSMYCGRANVEIISRIIQSLPNKGPGSDNIRVQDLKLICPSISPLLAKLINLTLDSGHIPERLKLAVYRPVYKGGEHKQYCNYRPIAQLNQIHKVMEKFIGNQLNNYLHQFNVINHNQLAYQKNKGTNNLLVEFSQLVFKCLNDRQQVLVLFVDYSKAYDLLEPSVLLK